MVKDLYLNGYYRCSRKDMNKCLEDWLENIWNIDNDCIISIRIPFENKDEEKIIDTYHSIIKPYISGEMTKSTGVGMKENDECEYHQYTLDVDTSKSINYYYLLSNITLWRFPLLSTYSMQTVKQINVLYEKFGDKIPLYQIIDFAFTHHIKDVYKQTLKNQYWQDTTAYHITGEFEDWSYFVPYQPRYAEGREFKKLIPANVQDGVYNTFGLWYDELPHDHKDFEKKRNLTIVPSINQIDIRQVGQQPQLFVRPFEPVKSYSIGTVVLANANRSFC